MNKNHLKFIYLRVCFGFYYILLLLHFLNIKDVILINPSGPAWKALNSPWIFTLTHNHFNLFISLAFISAVFFTLGIATQVFSFFMYLYLFCILNSNLYLVEVHYYFLNWALLAFCFYPEKISSSGFNFPKIFTKVSWLVFIFSMGLLGFAKLIYQDAYVSAKAAHFLFHLKDSRLHYSNFLYSYFATGFDRTPISYQTLISIAAGWAEFLILPLGLFKLTRKLAIALAIIVFVFIAIIMNYVNIAVLMGLFLSLGIDLAEEKEKYFI